jgi:hypothetical protein
MLAVPCVPMRRRRDKGHGALLRMGSAQNGSPAPPQPGRRTRPGSRQCFDTFRLAGPGGFSHSYSVDQSSIVGCRRSG